MEIAIIKPVPLITNATPLEAILLSDGSKGASMKSLCLPFDLARHGQVARIKRDPSLALALIQVTLKTSAGSRLLDVLLAYAIPLWLSGLNVSRLSPEKQERAAIMREGAIAAIEAAFTNIESQERAAEPQTALVAPDAFSLIQEGMLTMIAGMGQLQTGIAALQQTQATILARLAALEGMPRTYSGTGLPPEKVAHLVVLVRALRAKKGRDIDETLGKLAAYFHVGHFSDIPASAWADVLTLLEALMG